MWNKLANSDWFQWVRYSDVIFDFNLNPVRWNLEFEKFQKYAGFKLVICPIGIVVILSNKE